MILSYVCIIILAILTMNDKSKTRLRLVGLNSLGAMMLLLLGAILTILPSRSTQLLGLDYLSILLIIVAVYTAVVGGIRQLLPIFGGVLGVAVMSVLYQYVSAQLFNSVWSYIAYLAIMAVTTVVVSNSHSHIISAVLGISISQVIINLSHNLNVSVAYQPIGGTILVVILISMTINLIIAQIAKSSICLLKRANS